MELPIKKMHPCPLCGQGIVHKMIYSGNVKKITIFECDECSLFWNRSDNHTVENALGTMLVGMDNGFFDNNELGNVDEVIDEGGYY